MNNNKTTKILSVMRFTLVELLVVIAIIAILASLLFPALAKAQGAVKMASCKNNMKQMYLGLNNYLDEWKGNFPTSSNSTKMMHFYILEQVYPAKTALTYSSKTTFWCPSAADSQLQKLSYMSFYLTNTYSLNEAPNKTTPCMNLNLFR